jgi:hypothetical protein
MEIPAWLPAVFNVGWNTSEMATRILLICLSVVKQKLPPQNVRSRKLSCHHRRLNGDNQGNCNTAWHWMQCCTGDDNNFGIPEGLLSFGSPNARGQAHKVSYMDVSLLLLQQNAAEGVDFLLNTLTGNGNWFHSFDPRTKLQS